ncbi:MAG: ABC transporter permease [Chloroflexi bacterium]|nr:ABC transporter permease [Chloroflexota bacterium]
MAATAMPKHIDYISPARQRGMGITFLLIGLLIGVFFAGSIGDGSMTTFVMTPGGSATVLADLVFTTRPALNILATICLGLGAFQLIRGFGRRTNLALSLVAALLIFGFLSWIASGGSLNLAGLLRSMVVRAVPIALGAFAAMLNERAGVVNIAIEGMMLMGAMVGALVGSVSNLWLGLLAAVISGALMALIHGILSIRYKTDQIISSTMLLIFATGMTSFISARFMQKYQYLNNPGIFKTWAIPGLSKIPVIGPMFFEHNLFTYAMFFFVIVLHVALFYTRWGLRLRSVGEHPKAADTLGINVFRTRYMAVILSGMMAGFAGAYFTLGSVGRFDEVMTAGRGFIGLAAMIFGNWTPVGSFGAAVLFGFADSLSAKLGILGVSLPSEFLLMAPYLATMIVLAGVVGRGNMPAADGKPYEKE